MSYAEAASILVRPGVACCICGQEGESSDRQRVRHETAVSQALGNLKKEACEYETFRARRDRVKGTRDGLASALLSAFMRVCAQCFAPACIHNSPCLGVVACTCIAASLVHASDTIPVGLLDCRQRTRWRMLLNIGSDTWHSHDVGCLTSDTWHSHDVGCLHTNRRAT